MRAKLSNNNILNNSLMSSLIPHTRIPFPGLRDDTVGVNCAIIIKTTIINRNKSNYICQNSANKETKEERKQKRIKNGIKTLVEKHSFSEERKLREIETEERRKKIKLDMAHVKAGQPQNVVAIKSNSKQDQRFMQDCNAFWNRK